VANGQPVECLGRCDRQDSDNDTPQLSHLSGHILVRPVSGYINSRLCDIAHGLLQCNVTGASETPSSSLTSHTEYRMLLLPLSVRSVICCVLSCTGWTFVSECSTCCATVYCRAVLSNSSNASTRLQIGVE